MTGIPQCYPGTPEPCDRAETIIQRAINCGWVKVLDHEQLKANFRIALDTEVAAGGPYLNNGWNTRASQPLYHSQGDGIPPEIIEALDLFEGHMQALGALKGWRLQEMRAALARARSALSLANRPHPLHHAQTVRNSGDESAWEVFEYTRSAILKAGAGTKQAEIAGLFAAIVAARDVMGEPAQTVQVPDGFVMVPTAALDWLHGSAPDLDGRWFSDDEDEEIKTPRKYSRRYWWRTKFRKLCAVTSTDQTANRNWIEDAPHENGNYECSCAECGHSFIGHKRRVLCKLCSNLLTPSVSSTDGASR